ncbi:MAG: methyltransferase domain-containing protein [Candidatus Omnitrophota bacterium]
MQLIAKKSLKRSFSRYALTYDGASDFQRDAGMFLLKKISEDGFCCKSALDIGMGTGNITRALAADTGADVLGCDIAWGMVAASRGMGGDITAVQGDAEHLPFAGNSFDMVFSNIAYQWVPDLSRAFCDAARVLKQDGRFYFSILSKGSLPELYSVFKEAGDLMPPGNKIYAAVKDSGLKMLWGKRIVIRKYYDTSMDFLRALKQVGAGRAADTVLFGLGRRQRFLGMIGEYEKRFGGPDGVYATYEVEAGCAQKAYL